MIRTIGETSQTDLIGKLGEFCETSEASETMLNVNLVKLMKLVHEPIKICESSEPNKTGKRSEIGEPLKTMKIVI